MLALRLPKQTEKRLESLARRTGQTKSYYARLAIQEFLDDQEDYLIAMQRLKQDLQGIPLDEVERRLASTRPAPAPKCQLILARTLGLP